MRLLFLIMLALSAITQTAFACSCGNKSGYVSETLGQGLIIEATPLETHWIGGGKNSSSDEVELNTKTVLQIENSFGAILPNRLTVKHHNLGASCGVTFTMGVTGLEIIYRTEEGYVTGYCARPQIPEITIYRYLENGIDIFVPNKWQCDYEAQQLKAAKAFDMEPDIQLGEACEFWSASAKSERLSAAHERYERINEDN